MFRFKGVRNNWAGTEENAFRRVNQGGKTDFKKVCTSLLEKRFYLGCIIGCFACKEVFT